MIFYWVDNSKAVLVFGWCWLCATMNFILIIRLWCTCIFNNTWLRRLSTSTKYCWYFFWTVYIERYNKRIFCLAIYICKNDFIKIIFKLFVFVWTYSACCENANIPNDSNEGNVSVEFKFQKEWCLRCTLVWCNVVGSFHFWQFQQILTSVMQRICHVSIPWNVIRCHCIMQAAI